ncbi:MAG: hypothetical protein JNM48_07515 [Rhodospirillales bacterium]|nr:hypothetical protein [Rhodospirillales bacterium]
MRIPSLAGGIILTAMALLVLTGMGAAQTASPASATPTREELQKQLDAQNARNEELRQRIAKLEAVLKTDVCNNPEAEALLKAEKQAAPR